MNPLNCDIITMKYNGESDSTGELISVNSKWSLNGMKLYKHIKYVPTEYY